MNNSNFRQPSASPTKGIGMRSPPPDGGNGISYAGGPGNFDESGGGYGIGMRMRPEDMPPMYSPPAMGPTGSAPLSGKLSGDSEYGPQREYNPFADQNGNSPVGLPQIGLPRGPVNNTPLPSYGTLPAPSGAGFYGNALQQGQENRNTALYNSMTNNPNIRGPLGNQTVTYNNGVPTVTQALPEQTQKALEAQQRSDRSMSELGEDSARNAKSAMANPFQFQGPGLQTSIGDYTKMPIGGGMTAQQAMLSRLEPTLAQNRQSRMQELANQGVAQGTEAYRNQMTESGQNENDLRLQAALQGINVDLNSQQQEYGQALQNAQFGNTASNQSLERQLKLRNQPLDEYAAIRNASPLTMPNMPQFQGSNAAAAPLMEASRLQADMDINSINRNTAKTNADKSLYADIAKGIAGSATGQKLIDSGLGYVGGKIKGLFGGGSTPLDVNNSTLPKSQQGPTNANAGNPTSNPFVSAASGAAVPAAVAAYNAGLFAPAGQVLVSDVGGLLSSGTVGGAGAGGGAAGLYGTNLAGMPAYQITGAAAKGALGASAASTGGAAGLNLATLGPIGAAIALGAILKAQGKYTGRESSGTGTTDPYAGMGFNDTGYGGFETPDYADPDVQSTLANVDPDSGLRWEKASGGRDTVYYNKDGSEAYRTHKPRDEMAYVVEGSGVGVKGNNQQNVPQAQMKTKQQEEEEAQERERIAQMLAAYGDGQDYSSSY